MLILGLLACTPCDDRELGTRALWVVGDAVEWADAPSYSRRAVVDGDGALWTQGASVAKDGQVVFELSGESQDLTVVDGQVAFVERLDEGQLRLHYPADATPEDVPPGSKSYAAALWGDAESGLHLLRNGEPGGTFLRTLADNTWGEDLEIAADLPERDWLVLGPGPTWARTEGLDFPIERLEGDAVVSVGLLTGVDQVRGIVVDGQGSTFVRVGIDSPQDAWIADPETGCTAQLTDILAPFALQGLEEGAMAWGLSPQGTLLQIPVHANCELGSASEVDSGLDAELYAVTAATDGPTPLLVAEWVAGPDSDFAYRHGEVCR